MNRTLFLLAAALAGCASGQGPSRDQLVAAQAQAQAAVNVACAALTPAVSDPSAIGVNAKDAAAAQAACALAEATAQAITSALATMPAPPASAASK